MRVPGIAFGLDEGGEGMGSGASADPGRTRARAFELHHELDPRSSRLPLKVHGIFCPTGEGGWRKLSGDEILQGLGMGG